MGEVYQGWVGAKIPETSVAEGREGRGIPYPAGSGDRTPLPRRRDIVRIEGRIKEYMAASQPNNPLHGITLEMILTHLVREYGWAELGRRIPIKCFNENPSLKSSLKFLRQTPWARKKVEELYLKSVSK